MFLEIVNIFIGIDIGGSHIGVGFMNEKGDLMCYSDNTKLSNDISAADVIDLICMAISKLYESLLAIRQSSFNKRFQFCSVGVGCPGHCNNGVVVRASNLIHLRNFDIVRELSARLDGLPVTLINDADAAIAAEFWGNRNKSLYSNIRHVAMITIGTGIGLGLILDRKLFQGSRGLIEGGHMIVETNRSHARQCNCGQLGCVEAYASAKNTGIRMFEMDQSIDLNPALSANLTCPEGGSIEVFRRALMNDDNNSKQVLEDTYEYLAVLCINICRIIDPEVIIIGGGMSKAGDLLIAGIYRHFHARAWTVLSDNVKIVLAESSGYSGIIGATLAGKENYESLSASSSSSFSKSNNMICLNRGWSWSNRSVDNRVKICTFLMTTLTTCSPVSGVLLGGSSRYNNTDGHHIYVFDITSCALIIGSQLSVGIYLYFSN